MLSLRRNFMEWTMAKTPAERQRDLRARRQFRGIDGNGEREIKVWVNTRAALALDRLAASYGVTKREVIERLLIEEQEKVLQKIDIDSPEGEKFLKGSKVTA
jgi:hypothetical protein